MLYREYRDLVKSDRLRYNTNLGHLKMFLINPSYKLSVRYRRCAFLREKKFLKLLYYFERLIYHRTCVKYGCDIPSHVKISSGLRVDHPYGIVINSKAIIGSNLTIKSGALIGANDKGIPKVGNNVLIGAHALIIGNIQIGDYAEIGAGAIVTHDVPNNAIVICDAAHISRVKK